MAYPSWLTRAVRDDAVQGPRTQRHLQQHPQGTGTLPRRAQGDEVSLSVSVTPPHLFLPSISFRALAFWRVSPQDPVHLR